MADVEETIKTGWQKFVAAVKSAPATFAYGLAIGVVIGAIIW